MTRALTDATDRDLAHALHAVVQPLHGTAADFDALVARARTVRYVLIGEASHGTHDFYKVRAELTKRLIREAGYQAVAIEGDWPDAALVNQWVRGHGTAGDAVDALGGFARFPQWMWRNADVLDFVGWLRAENEARGDPAAHVGFYGLDLYSLHASMAAVLAYLDGVDRAAAARARARYACFDRFGPDPQDYGADTMLRLTPSCERAVLDQLVELQRSAEALLRRDGRVARDAQFFAEQNARLVRNAERYYRLMFLSNERSWNCRDEHMAETLAALAAHLSADRAPARIVVWAHNSHLGDARATEMARHGELNLGQLVRTQAPGASLHIGFTTYDGTVTAARGWDAPAERRRVRPAIAGSYEALFHEVGLPAFLAELPGREAPIEALASPRLERAIGVIYRPETERRSHYFEASLPAQFDAVLHYDRTRALEPLERTTAWVRGELPETFPSAL